MRLPLFLGAVVCFLRATTAVFAEEAWSVDYHHALLGRPKEETTFFHRPNAASRASLIYTLSEQGVLGAVNPRDGSLVWRQLLLPDAGPANASFLRAGHAQDVVVSAIGNQIAAWSAADGRQAWARTSLGPLEDLEILELSDGRETRSVKDAIVLTGGERAAIQRLHGATGDVQWTHHIDSGDVPYQISASSTNIFGIALHKTMLGHVRIKVVSLDPVNGRKTDEYTLSSDSELVSPDTIVSVGANSASPIIAWTDAAYTILKVNIIGTKTVAAFNIEKQQESPVTCVRLHAPYHTNSLSHFLVQFETEVSHWAEVFHIDLITNKVVQAYSLPKISGQGTFSTSSSDANVYFTRITQHEVVTLSSASHGELGRWALNGITGIASSREVISAVHSVSEVSSKGSDVSAVRSAILLSTGDWILIRDGSPLWQRPEALADTTSAVFATPEGLDAFAEDLEIEAHSNFVSAYVHRIRRHIQGLQRLPEVLRALPQRFKDGVFGTTAESSLTGDIFGFHRIVACATRSGRVIALDAGAPNKILWNVRAVDVMPGKLWEPSFKSSAEGVLVVKYGKNNEIRLNATTGEPAPVSSYEEPPTSAPGSVHLTLRDGTLEAFKTHNAVPTSLWHFVPSTGERVYSIVSRSADDPVASIGRVLGDRRVLYKYISLNVALLVTVNDVSRTATFYVLDTISGTTIHAGVHPGVELMAPIASIMTENWFAYSYTSESPDGVTKGHHLVVGEMFESFIPNDRGPLGSNTNSSSLDSPPEPFVVLKSYQISEVISKLSVTQTRQGITSRQLLAVLPDSNSVVGIPYPVLDPRRPIGRDPTKDEQMEGLVRYAPVIEFDPKWYLNHQREVFGVRDVITSPALIESTSLVFAYGLDVFGTRLTPSFSFDILGKDFNKFQMLATVAALAVTTFVVAPLVARKQVNTRWLFA